MPKTGTKKCKKEGKTRVKPLPTWKRNAKNIKKRLNRLAKMISRKSAMPGAPPMAFIYLHDGVFKATGSQSLCQALRDSNSFSFITSEKLRHEPLKPCRDNSSDVYDCKGIDPCIAWDSVSSLKVMRTSYSRVVPKKAGHKKPTYMEHLKPEFWPEGLPFVSHSKRKDDGGRIITANMMRSVLQSFGQYCKMQEEKGLKLVNIPETTGDEDETIEEEVQTNCPEPVQDETIEEEVETNFPDPVQDETIEEEVETNCPEPVQDKFNEEDVKANLPQEEDCIEESANRILRNAITNGGNTLDVVLPKRGKRYHVCGEVLETDDIATLHADNWLCDKVLNAFLRCLMVERNTAAEGHIYVLPSYLASLWEAGRYDAWLYRNVKISMYDWVFLPVNVNGNHWVLLAADVTQKSVSILDSMSSKPNRVLIEKWRRFMKIRAGATGESLDWSVGSHTSSKQKDGSSCGPFVLLNAMALMHGCELKGLTQEDAISMRNYVIYKLLHHATEPPSQRTVCDLVGCTKPGHKKPWICCGNCGRWIHFACAGIMEVPKKDFICTVCHAQYF